MTIQELFESYRGKKVFNLKNGGNRGDALINRSVSELFEAHGVEYEDVWFPDDVRGEVLFVNGCGNFCKSHHAMVHMVRFYEDRFDRIVLLPSSFEMAFPVVGDFIANLGDHVSIYCRERYSFEQVAEVVDRDRVFLDSDMAFYFDWSKIDVSGSSGVLNAFRTDKEKSGNVVIPAGNRDLSVDPKLIHNWRVLDAVKHLPRTLHGKIRASFEKQRCYDFINEIAKFDEVHTDRAHVAITGAMLGKVTYLHQNNYHKIKGIYENSMAHLPNVTLM